MQMFRVSGLTALALCLFIFSGAWAQGFQSVFPGLSGNELIDSLASNYRPATVLDYANSRDTLYALLAADDDSVRCIYSGHTLYLDPTQDPTQYLFQNGGTNGMNAEHSYPQSKGATAGTNAHSDMHHLYPTRIALNDARGDKPYAEIPDAQTQKWFVNNLVFTSIPTSHIELYAESGSATFEPREASKGDVARSILYFYTVYRSQANNADPAFFEQQRATLCQWNESDPADPSELRKTWRIAAHQDGKPNPFVLDCTLAHRSWCPEVAASCALSTKDPAAAPALQLKIMPQPVVNNARVFMNLPFDGEIHGRILSLLGREISAFDLKNATAGAFELPFDAGELAASGAWLGFLEVTLLSRNGAVRQVVPLMVAH